MNEIIDEMNCSLLSDRDRAHAVRDAAFSKWDDEIEHNMRWGKCAFVTRNMTREERLSTRGKSALTEELLKVIKKGTFGGPVNGRLAAKKFPKATVSGLCMLASVKHAEKSAELQKMKGRIVVLGNKIFLLGSGKETFPKGKDFGLFGDVASLAAFRAVAFHSTAPGHVLESADVANAYLNASWPEDQEKHFLRVDRQIFDLLPPEWQKMVNDAGGPGVALLPMDKCLYGHPLSGFLWIQQLHNFLLEQCGFTLVPGTKALYKRGNVLVCAYVDDLAVAGPKDEVDELWKKLSLERGGRYDLREVGECTEFLGVQVKRRQVDNGFEVDLSMEDYCKSIVKNFEELFQDCLQGVSTNVEDDEELVNGFDCHNFLLEGTCVHCDMEKSYLKAIGQLEGSGREQKTCTLCVHGRRTVSPVASVVRDGCQSSPSSNGPAGSDGLLEGPRTSLLERVCEDGSDGAPSSMGAAGPATPARACAARGTSKVRTRGTGKPGGQAKSAKKVGVRPRLVPMSPEQDESIREQHLWPSTDPQKRVMKLVGQLLWVARCTRTDVSYPVSRLASGISRWRDEQNIVMSQVVGYLKRTAKMVLRFVPADPRLEVSLEIHTDASWHTPRSQSGCALVAVQYPDPEDRDKPKVLGLIDWNSNKQGLTADSSAASELVSAHFGVRNSLPLAVSLREFWRLEHKVVSIRIDNKAVIDVAKSGSSKGLTWLATKPFSIRAGCLHDLFELGVIAPEFIGTEGQLSDVNTKALAKLKLAAILEKLNLKDLGNVTSPKSKSTKRQTPHVAMYMRCASSFLHVIC